MKPGRLFMIPVPLHPEGGPAITDFSHQQIKHLKHFIAENAKVARKWIKLMNLELPIQQIIISPIDKHLPQAEQLSIMQPLLDGHDLGFISDAGSPGFADPGNVFVRYAHRLDIEVVPLSGPVSIILALMASGLNGQQFTFHGYLAVQQNDKIKQLKQIQADAVKSGSAHFFIETPYRNNQLIESVINSLQANLLFTIAANLTAPEAYIKTRSVSHWKSDPPPDLHKIPAIFGLGI